LSHYLVLKQYRAFGVSFALVLSALVACSQGVEPGGTGESLQPMAMPNLGSTERVSIDSSGNQGNNISHLIDISADGRFIVFQSDASNLVPGDTNNATDIFVRDLYTGVTERVSVDDNGNEGHGRSEAPVISADGRYVVFQSSADELADPGYTGNYMRIILRDRHTGTTEHISVLRLGYELVNSSNRVPDVSDDGRYVSFSSTDGIVSDDQNGLQDIYVRDRQSGTSERVSVGMNGQEANGASGQSSISGDGRYVAFFSFANNLVPGDTNNVQDVFVFDRQTGITTRASVDNNGGQADGASENFAASISDNGRYIGFHSGASNLVPGDTNNKRDVFMRDLQAGTTELISLSTECTGGDGESYTARISSDGRYVSFGSGASNLVPGDTNGVHDAFVRDRQTGITKRVSISSSGDQGNNHSVGSKSSTDGRYVAVSSLASNLVVGDTNMKNDVFVHHIDWAAESGTGGQCGTPSNTSPTVDAGADATLTEGSTLTGTGSFTDSDTDLWTATVDYGDGSGVQPLTLNSDKTFSLNHRYLDNGSYTITVTVGDGTATASDSLTATVTNIAPTVGSITVSSGQPTPDVVPVGTSVSTSASYSDPGLLDTHTASWNWGDGSTDAGQTSATDGSGTATGSHTYSTPGVYTLILTVTDKDGDSGQSVYEYVVVYDSDGGFVTGGGWITSPLGACKLSSCIDETTGKANFGFVSKYQKGATIPTGQTQFQFQAGNLNFHSSSYEWLVVSGSRAQYKGEGSINGTSGYGFMLTAVDGEVSGGGGTDKFRIKIWEKASGTVVYDNQPGAEDDATPSTVIGGGSIIIHSQK
jgi:hypothetical protein